jgi:hypothetical protein
MRNLLLSCIALSLLGCETTRPRTSASDLMGMTKQQVIARLGFPAAAARLPARARGGGAFETWTYYQRSDWGGIELKNVGFGNSFETLGRVVTYSPDIVSSRIISPDTREGFSAITEYDAKHGR